MAAGINDTFRQVGRRGRDRGLGSDLPRHRRLQGAGSSPAARSATARPATWSKRPRPERCRRRWPRYRRRAREATRSAAEQGFIHGLNEILLLGAILSFAGSLLALWLVRERDIERETLNGTEFEVEPESGAPAPEAASA